MRGKLTFEFGADRLSSCGQKSDIRTLRTDEVGLGLFIDSARVGCVSGLDSLSKLKFGEVAGWKLGYNSKRDEGN